MAVTNIVKGPIKMSAAADAITGRFGIKWILWVGATTAGHTLVINDSAGNLIWSHEANGANYSFLMPIDAIFDGIVATTMGSGYILIYCD